jgi:hypothetical protein
MRDSDLTKLHRAGATIRIDQPEPQLAGYRAKLANLEARIHEIIRISGGVTLRRFERRQ